MLDMLTNQFHSLSKPVDPKGILKIEYKGIKKLVTIPYK